MLHCCVALCPIPIFQNTTASDFVGNPGLCGNSTGLLPCKRFARKNNKVLILVLGLVCGVAIFVIAIVITLILYHNRERKQNCREDQAESLIWEREGKFTFGEIVEATEDFDDKYCIGKGGVGTVYKAVLRSGLVLAVKRLHMSDSSDIPEIYRTSFQNEVRSLTDVRHRNIMHQAVWILFEEGLYVLGGENCARTGACTFLLAPLLPANRAPRRVSEQYLARSGFSSAIVRLWHGKIVEP
ncbi:hypothetical protein TIFTF001_018203 [Ficus carica]|uniref:non-specific serine/threonine protein kinase n=1 Tax=Ficus carica TaxID=3494 RepID=A0AA88AVA4_FICCA|nr:hypothetical protein TIFTF001_018203 [Ficus carica]